jgi:hypothetical protein
MADYALLIRPTDTLLRTHYGLSIRPNATRQIGHCDASAAQRCAKFDLTEDEMGKTVDVTIPVEPEAAAARADARNREAVGRLVSRFLRAASGPTPLARAIAEMKVDARAAGLGDTDIDAELAAYNAERRERA